MLRIAWLYVALAVVQAAGPARQNQDSANDINALLTAYEKRDPSLPPDPEALGKIARMVMAKAARSQTFRVWSEECASTFVTDKAACDAKLQRTLDDTTKPVTMRAAAGAVLMKHKAPKAADSVFALLKPLSAAQLTPLVGIVRQLPPDRAVPLLLRLLGSSADGDKFAACRELGAFDTPQVREALKKAVTQAPPGLEVWKACTLARVRLQEPDTAGAINGITHESGADALMDAIDVMADLGNENVIYVLQRMAQEGRPLSQMEAAARLADKDPAFAARLVDRRLADPDPEVRAAALLAERRLKRVPSPAVRKLLVDPSEIVQVRAAEAVIDWVVRTRKQ
jgi:hypothetical protein